MIARLFPFAVAAVLAVPLAASAQTPPVPQPGPTTVANPNGATTLPPNGSQRAPASYGDPGNDAVAAPKLGPQQKLGQAINRTVHYVAGDIIAPPIVYDAYAPGAKGLNGRSYAGRAVFEVPLGSYDVYVAASARKWVYPTHAGAVTGIGPQGSAIVPSFTGIGYDQDVRAGIKVTGPRVYGAVSYLTRGGNTEPRQHGVGYGVEKLADVDQLFSLYGNVFYYPNVGGRYSLDGVGDYGVSYRELRYTIGVTLRPSGSPVFLDAGYLGDRSKVRTDAPVGFNHQGPYLGLGVRF